MVKIEDSQIFLKLPNFYRFWEVCDGFHSGLDGRDTRYVDVMTEEDQGGFRELALLGG